jgi:hypothetical protein
MVKDAERLAPAVHAPEHKSVALEMAQQRIVLLQN